MNFELGPVIDYGLSETTDLLDQGFTDYTVKI